MSTASLQEIADIMAKVLDWDSSTSSAEVSGVQIEIGSGK
jgi:hypothetical protein